MKLESYTPSVRGNVQQARTGVAGNLETRGGNDTTWGQLGKVAGIAIEAQIKRQEDDDALRVANAQSEYIRRTNEVLYGDGGMAYRQGENATRTREDYLTAEKDIRAQVLSESGIKTRRGQELFQRQVEKSLTANEADILGWEEKGRKQWIADTATNKMEATLAAAINTGNIKAAYDGVDQGLALQSSYLDEAGYQAEQRKRYTDVTNRMVGTLINAGNYTKALTAIEHARETGLVSGDVLEKLESAAKEKKGVLQAKENAADYATYFSGQGKRIWEVTREAFSAVFREKNKGRGGSRAEIVERFLAATCGQESHGDYNVENNSNAASGRVARGKYQIIDGTWQTYAPKAGLDANAPRTPENQEKVARAMAEEYYDLTGGDTGQMAACWYVGSPVTGWSQEALNRPQISDDGTVYPSIQEYMDAVQARMGGGQLTEGQLFEQEEREWRAFQAQAAEQERAYRQDLQRQKDSIEDALETMTPEEQLQFLQEQTAGNEDLKRAYRPAIRALKAEGAKIHDSQMDGIKQLIATRKIQDPEDLTSFFERNGLKPTFAQYKQLSNELTAANEGTGKYRYTNDAAIKSAVKKLVGNKRGDFEALWPGASVALNNEAVKYQQEHQGQMPPPAWLEQTAARLMTDNISFAHHPQTQITRAELGTYGYSNAQEVSNERGEIFIRMFAPDGEFIDVGADQLPYWLEGVRSGEYGRLGFNGGMNG